MIPKTHLRSSKKCISRILWNLFSAADTICLQNSTWFVYKILQGFLKFQHDLLEKKYNKFCLHSPIGFVPKIRQNSTKFSYQPGFVCKVKPILSPESNSCQKSNNIWSYEPTHLISSAFNEICLQKLAGFSQNPTDFVCKELQILSPVLYDLSPKFVMICLQNAM